MRVEHDTAKARGGAWAKNLVGTLYAFFFARAGKAQAVNHALYHLSLRGMGYNNGWTLDRSGEGWFIAKVLPHFDLRMCLDIGANVGNYSAYLMRHTSALVVAFEPLPHCRAILVNRFARSDWRGRFAIQGFALSDVDGSATLHTGTKTSEHASLSTEINGIDYVRTGNTKALAVQTLTLDTWWDTMSYYVTDHLMKPPVDFIKIDVEGLEWEVLVGGRKMIEECAPKFVQIEWNLHQLMTGHTLRSVAGLLPNYDAYQLLPKGMRRIDVNRPEANTFCYANIVFVRSDIGGDLEAVLP